MELHLKIIGSLLMLLALFHIPFPKYFQWKKNLESLTLINRQMMKTHTFFIALTVFLMGLLCISSSHELINTVLGRRIALGLGIFWIVRLLFQLFVYSSKLWRGKKFETSIHVLFTLFWCYLSFVFIKIYFIQ